MIETLITREQADRMNEMIDNLDPEDLKEAFKGELKVEITDNDLKNVKIDLKRKREDDVRRVLQRQFDDSAFEDRLKEPRLDERLGIKKKK